MADHALTRSSIVRQWSIVARRSPGRAAMIAYWAVTHRWVRARWQLRAAISEHMDPYSVWVTLDEWRETGDDALAPVVAALPRRPVVSVLALSAPGEAEWVDRVLQGLQTQPYVDWELLVLSDTARASTSDQRVREVAVDTPGHLADRLAASLEVARGDWVLPLMSAERLTRQALVRLLEAADGTDADLVYGDEDLEEDDDGSRSDPWWKPEWNEELALATDFLTGAALLRRQAARRQVAHLPEGDAAPYALALRVALASPTPPVHAPHMVAHRRRDRGTADGRRPVVASLLGSSVSVSTGQHDTVQVHWPLPDPAPLVSIIVPTRDRRDLLEPCIESVRRSTSYPSFQVLIVDNDTTDPDTLTYLREVADDPRVTVLPFAEPYNYSRINNVAVNRSHGDFLCLLNNDTQVITPDWLSALVRQANRAHIGAAGAKLLYEDGTIQHAGVAIGLGNAAGHSHRHQPNTERGYHGVAHCAHYVSAVTAACLVVARHKFLAVGGLDERELQIAYNDVDLCLKLQRAGWRNVFVPDAVLFHFESRSRGSDFSPVHRDRYSRELAKLQARWNTTAVIDPMHHPRLDRASETYRHST